MWTSVYMTQNIDIARVVREKIENNSIPVMLHRICVENVNNEVCYELLVPDAELSDALEIIINK